VLIFVFRDLRKKPNRTCR